MKSTISSFFPILFFALYLQNAFCDDNLRFVIIQTVKDQAENKEDADKVTHLSNAFSISSSHFPPPYVDRAFVKAMRQRLKNKRRAAELQKEITLLEQEHQNNSISNQLIMQTQAQVMYEDAMAILSRPRSERRVALNLLRKSAALNHKKARAELAWFHMIGDMVELNPKYAADEFDELSLEGLSEAHMGLAFLHSVGIGGKNVSQAKVLLHLTFAALGNNTFAQMALGYRYASGINFPKDCQKALEFYKSVAKKVAASISFVNSPIVHRTRLLDEFDNPGNQQTEIVDYYHLLADKGDVTSQIGLGQLYFQGGRDIAQNHQKALEYFTLAANSGNSMGYAFLGKLYLEGGDAIKANNETALKYFEKAAELNDPIGQSGLGLMYLKGMGVAADPKKAFDYFKLAANQGWVDGQVQLGIMYLTGNGVKSDLVEAEKLFKAAAAVGNVLAYYNLGRMTAYGIGMQQNCPAAVDLFKTVAERGRWSALFMRAYKNYKSGRIDESFVQYALLSEVGYEVAQSNAAFLLDHGEVKMFKDQKENYLRAFYQLKRAADQENALAQLTMGDYYYYGWGVEQDFEMALAYYKRAVDVQNNAQAAFNLGYMHENGLGIERDLHLAKRMYDVAASLNQDAKIPVGLALLKLQFISKLEEFQDTPLNFLLTLDENFTANWDLYMITVLTLLLAIVMYTQRPRQQQMRLPQENNPQPNQPIADASANQAQQNVVPPTEATTSSHVEQPPGTSNTEQASERNQALANQNSRDEIVE